VVAVSGVAAVVGIVVSGFVVSGFVVAGVVLGVVVGVGSGVVVGVVEGSVVVVVSTGDSCAPTGPDVSAAARIVVAARIVIATTPRSCRRWVMRSIRFGSWRESRWR
jgi:hypothetical protein